MEEQQLLFEQELESLKRQEIVIHEQNKKLTAKRNIRRDNKEALTLDDFMKITKIEHKIIDLKKSAQEEVISINEEIERNNAEVKRLESEITDLKMKRVIFKYRLKECYVNILKKPSTTM